MKFKKNELGLDFDRVFWLFILIVLGFIVIILRSWYLQIMQGQYYAFASERNRIRHIEIRASRGLILDRDRIPLLQNRHAYDLAITPQYLIQPEETIMTLKKLFNFSDEEIDNIYRKIEKSPQFLPVVVKKNLSFHEASVIQTHKFFLTGVDIITRPSRWYQGNEQAHLIGYLGEISQKEMFDLNQEAQNDRFPPYKMGTLIGKNGIEKKHEIYLRGHDGKKMIQVDAHGRIYSDKSFRISALYQDEDAKPGYNVVLTISKKLQDAASHIFQGQNGALVVLDVKTSAVLAYVSHPNYDLNLYVNGISKEDWDALRTHPNKPLIDKVTGGVYAPGSVYKVITAIAGLEEKVIKPNTTFNCPGFFSIGRGHWRCWKKTGHGPMSIVQALEQSCDVFFYNLGHLVGVNRLVYWAEQFGLGQKTGLDLNYEHAGLNPSVEWKKEHGHGEWQVGDTINMAIGQGFVLVTPIQVANLYAAIANGGYLHQPYITKSILGLDGQEVFHQNPTLIRKIPVSDETLDLIRKSLFRVVNGPAGTARRARAPYKIAGKTGTSENVSAHFDKNARQEDLPVSKRDHGWFVGYAPADQPEVVIAVLSENAGGGGAVSAPIAKAVLDVYFSDKGYPIDPTESTALVSSH